MKAIDFDSFGDASVLALTDRPDPAVRPHDLLVRVRAAGVNRADILHRQGNYGRSDFGDSTLMGLEIAGEVVARRASITAWPWPCPMASTTCMPPPSRRCSSRRTKPCCILAVWWKAKTC